MIIESISHLKKYNFSNELKLYLMNFEKIDFHQVCIFPYNILVLVNDDDGSDESYIFFRQTREHYQLVTGNYYFIPTGLAIEYCLRPNISYYTFHIGLEVYPGMDLFSSCRQVATGNAEQMLSDIAGIYQEKDEFLSLCRLRKMLLEFLISHWPTNFPHEKIPEDFRKLMQYITIHADANMRVETLAARMNITPEAFSRKFHCLVSITPKAFIVKCLIEKITTQLCDSNKTIRRISEELNFSSEFYLSRFFKKAIGIPPITYKKMVTKK